MQQTKHLIFDATIYLLFLRASKNISFSIFLVYINYFQGSYIQPTG